MHIPPSSPQEKKYDVPAVAQFRCGRRKWRGVLEGDHLAMSFASELLRSVPATRKSKGRCLLRPRRWLMTSDSPCRERRAGTTIGALDTLSSSPRFVVKLICDGRGGFQATCSSSGDGILCCLGGLELLQKI